MRLQVRLVKRFAPGPDSGEFRLDVDFETDSGITMIFGASGAGKSLTLDCIAGFVTPDPGRILLDGSILFDSAARVNVPPRDRHCGYVFQNYALFPHMTLRENLAFAAERRPGLERRRRVNEMIERFRLGEVAGRRPAEVSGGQRQRCSIGRALIADPRILLLDEPARGFDAALRADFHTMLRELRTDLNIPMLFVTHDLDEAVALGDHMLVYQAGRVAQAGAPQSILSRPASLEIARLLGQVTILEARIVALDPGRNTSRIRIEQGELGGPYFPGHLLGDRAWLLIRSDDLRIHGSPGSNRVPVTLEGKTEHARFIELRFSGGVTALAPRHEFELHRLAREWYVEFPADSLRLLKVS